MFSSRFHWSHRPNRLTEVLAEKRQAGACVLDLTESNPTHAGLEYPTAVIDSFHNPRVLDYQPAPAGSLHTRAAVSRYYETRGHAVPAERILLTASTSEAYAYLFKLLADPGDHVLVPRPSYPLFEFLATMESIGVRQYPLHYHGGWSIDLHALEEMIDERTRAIILVNPNNPTGSYVKRGELAKLATLGVPLISDEVFSDYALAPDPERVTTLASVQNCLAFSMSGLSKVAGLPQLKLGWMVVSGPESLRTEAFEKLEWIADTYLSVGTPVQCAAEQLLATGEQVQEQIRSRCAANLASLRAALDGTSATVLEVEGGWYATIQVPRTKSEEEWTLDLLAQQNVLLQPGYFYDFSSEAFLIASLLTAPEIFNEGIRRLGEALQSRDREGAVG